MDKFVEAGGFRIRYIEDGAERAPVVLMLHGASLGSSADVFTRNLGAFAKAGFRAIAFDQPGHGLSDAPSDTGTDPGAKDPGVGITPAFMDALGITRAALIGHSRAGGQAIQLALKDPARYTGIVVLGTGSLLPPLGEVDAESEAAAQKKQERKQATIEPTPAETRRLLEADLFHHDLITEAALARRHAMSIGRNFQAFAARNAPKPGKGEPKPVKAPLYERLGELKVPLLMIYGRQDRANAGPRAELLKRRQPSLDLHIIENCKHLVPWDAADAFADLAIDFLKGAR
ncbi:MAG TPA: alpha/beta hydrolase [Stellaceae bacterium]|nr:alpha/beta hydrolase [Stellaceae bacterium]